MRVAQAATVNLRNKQGRPVGVGRGAAMSGAIGGQDMYNKAICCAQYADEITPQ